MIKTGVYLLCQQTWIKNCKKYKYHHVDNLDDVMVGSITFYDFCSFYLRLLTQ